MYCREIQLGLTGVPDQQIAAIHQIAAWPQYRHATHFHQRMCPQAGRALV